MLIHFPVPCKYFIFHNFFCSFQSLVLSVLMYVKAFKWTWGFKRSMPTFQNLFFGKFEVLCFLVTLVLRFALLPYCRRIGQKMSKSSTGFCVLPNHKNWTCPAKNRQRFNDGMFFILTTILRCIRFSCLPWRFYM